MTCNAIFVIISPPINVYKYVLYSGFILFWQVTDRYYQI